MDVGIKFADGFSHDVGAFSDDTGVQRFCRGNECDMWPNVSSANDLYCDNHQEE